MTASRAPASSRARGVGQERVQPVELAVDPDAQRLERPRRRVDALIAARRNRAPDDLGELRRWSRSAAETAPATMARAMRREWRSSPNWKITFARSSSSTSHEQVGRGRPLDLSMRMSSGSSRRKLKPRPSRVELHRRHAEIGEHAVDAADAAGVEDAAELPIVRVHELDAIAERRQRARRRAAARRASRSRPISASAPASSMRALWPPRPTVQSTNSPPRDGIEHETTSRPASPVRGSGHP